MMARTGVKAAVAGALALLAAGGAASAGPITVDAGWYGFCFGGVGSPATAGCQNGGIGTTGNPFTFDATGPVRLQVTDAFQYGDIFQVVVNSVTYSTSTPGSGLETSDPDTAFAGGLYSRLDLDLGAGSYTVNVFAAASPFSLGGAYLQVVSVPVPEPATLALVGVGLAGLLAARRRRAPATA